MTSIPRRPLQRPAENQRLPLVAAWGVPARGRQLVRRLKPVATRQRGTFSSEPFGLGGRVAVGSLPSSSVRTIANSILRSSDCPREERG
jgi:hypothetical protein